MIQQQDRHPDKIAGNRGDLGVDGIRHREFLRVRRSLPLMAEPCDALAREPRGLVGPQPWSNARQAGSAVAVAIVLYLAWRADPSTGSWPWSVLTYTPLLVFGTVLCGLAVAWRVMAFLKVVARWTGAGAKEPPAPRLSWVDALIMLNLALASVLILEAVRVAANPEGICLGADHNEYLRSIIAVASGRWDIYHPNRSLSYCVTSFLAGRVFDLPYHVAAQAVSECCTLLIAPLTYCTALPLLGRTGAVLSALLVMAFPPIHDMSLVTTSYPLFDLLYLLVVTTGVWALVGGRTHAYAALGVSAAACMATQQQGLLWTPPVLVVASLAAFRPLPLGRSAALRCLALFAPIVLYAAVTPLLPVRYSPLSTTIVTQRVEIYRRIPYTWPAPLAGDPTSPSPLSSWLPAFMRGTEFEALASVVLAPPHSNVVGFREGSRGAFEVPRTTMPPLSHRVQANLTSFLQRGQCRQTWDVLLVLVLLGGIALVGLRPGWTAGRRWGAILLLTSLLPLANQFFILFELRWVVWSVPLLAILMVHALQKAGDLCLGSQHGPQSMVKDGLVVWMVLSLALSLLTGERDTWLSPALHQESVRGAVGRLGPVAGDIRPGLAEARAARWIQANLPREARILDATATVWLLLSQDDRFVPRPTDFAREWPKMVAAPPSHRPTFLVAGFGPTWKASTSLGEQAMGLGDLWKPLYAVRWDTQEEYDPAGMTQIPPNTLVIFGSAMQPR